MLNRILHEIEMVDGVLNLDELVTKLGVERSALEAMIQFWVRKGRLVSDSDVEDAISGSICSCASYVSSHIACTGCSGCVSAKVPRSYVLKGNK